MLLRKFKIVLCLLLLSVAVAHADINAYIQDLNVAAQGDIGGYKAKLKARFGTNSSQIEVVFRSVESPGDAAIVFWLGEQARQPLDKVLNVYRSQKSQGWGAMAKRLGIKPGSSAFHALKKGNLQLSLHDSGAVSNSNGKSHNKNKKPKKNKHG